MRKAKEGYIPWNAGLAGKSNPICLAGARKAVQTMREKGIYNPGMKGKHHNLRKQEIK